MSNSPSDLQRRAARSIVTKYLRVRPGENAVIESWDHTLSLAKAMVNEVRRSGGKALLIHEDEDSWWRAIDRGQSKLLSDPSAPEWAALGAADVYVNFWGPGDTDRIEKLPEETFEEAFDWNSYWYDAARKAGLRGVRMTAGFVTEGRARQWGLNRTRWQDDLLRACLVDPKETARSAARLSKALSGGKMIRIVHRNGTDLELALADAPPRALDGRPRPYRRGGSPTGMLQQVPSGTVSVALDSKTAEGSFRANRRTNIWWGWHAGARLDFQDGRLTAFAFTKGKREFVRQFRTATAGKDRPGALTFGLNPAVHDVPNLETVERGNVTLQIGRNLHLGGTNRSNFFTWFSLAGAEITVDGTPVIRNGEILA
jgi:leucyl aminopeptidase (aminopeptidase T)